MQGETGQEMFFVSTGSVEIMSPDEKSVKATLGRPNLWTIQLKRGLFVAVGWLTMQT